MPVLIGVKSLRSQRGWRRAALGWVQLCALLVVAATMVLGIVTGRAALALFSAGLLLFRLVVAMAMRTLSSSPSRAADATVHFSGSPQDAIASARRALQFAMPDLEQIPSDPYEVAVDIPPSYLSFGERMTLVVVENAADACEIVVTSQGRRPSLIDYGKNRRNVARVVEALSHQREERT